MTAEPVTVLRAFVGVGTSGGAALLLATRGERITEIALGRLVQDHPDGSRSP